MLNSSRNLRFCFLLWLAFVSAFTVPEKVFNVYAQSTTIEARVTSVSGNATLSGNNRTAAKLQRGAVLAPGHEIDTRGGGRVVIDLSDGSQVVVLPGSRLVVGDYRNAGSLRELLQITLGRIRVRINHFKNKPNPYRVKSPTASIAVRGTEFEVTVEAAGETRVVVLDGSVEVAALRDLTDFLVAVPGRGVIVRPDFTLDFFVPGLTTDEKNKNRKNSSTNNQNNGNAVINSAAANVYERFVENLVLSDENALPSRFSAFPDAHLDSVDNPAYAAAFNRAEGRTYFAPSFSDVDEDKSGAINAANPVDYGIGLQGTVFVPLKPFRLIVGASGNFVTNGLQSFAGNSDVSLNNPPFFSGDASNYSKLETTNNKFFNGSLIVARKFGSRDQTSVGLSFERLTSNGNLSGNNNQTGMSSPPDFGFSSAAYRVNRRSVTFGVKHDFSRVELGAFYRYNNFTVNKGTSSRSLVDGFSNNSDSSDSKGSSSEIGFRLRGMISERLFYGIQGSFLSKRSREDFQHTSNVELKQRSTVNRGTIGFGLGYFWRPRTIFSFDATGGLSKANQNQSENFTGNVLETRRRRGLFLSAHVAVQTDVWRSLFVSASILSVNQSVITDATLYPHSFGRRLNAAGVFTPNDRTRISASGFYSNFGIGWRFKPNFIFQYILTTDYGKSAPRHSFQLRYTFDFSRK